MLPSFACDGEGDNMHILKYGTPFLRSGFYFGSPLKEDRPSNDMNWEEEAEYLIDEYASDFAKLYTEAAAEANDDTFTALMAPETFAFGSLTQTLSEADMFFAIGSF